MEQPCQHFGDCGGCQAQDIPYSAQLDQKSAQLGEIFRPFHTQPIPVEPSPAMWHYRNKVDFNFALKRYPEAPPPGFERETVLGFRAKGKWYWPLDIQECRIAPQGTGALLDSLRAWLNAQNLRAFDSRSKEGFLKALLVRAGHRTGERMVVLVTAPGPFEPGPFIEAVQSSFPATSIYRGILERPSDIAFAEEMELLHGAPTIQERLDIPTNAEPRSLSFRVSPFSFFQTNTLATERLYGAIRQWVDRVQPAILYDLYGGMGGIALACSDLVKHVWSVENVESATLDGRHNAETNNVTNIGFLTMKVKNYLRALLQEGPLEDGTAVILDPPRSGMHPKALKRIVELRAPNVLYVSCKPTVFAQELPTFLEAYRIENMSAVDLFPHTGHVEVLTQLVPK